MQQPEQGDPVEPSRRQPPRAPAADAIPIPEAAARPRPRPSGVRDVLAAHQRAVDARIEEGLREIRFAVAEAVGRPDPEPELAEPAQVAQPPAEDVVRGLLAHTEERFQALSLRLRRIEDVLRSIGKREGPEVDQHLEALRRSISSIAATQQQEFARVTDFQRKLAERVAITQRRVAEALVKQQRRTADALATQQRDAIADLGSRIGRGIAAIARQMQDDLQSRQDALLERYLRGLAGELRRHQERRMARPAPVPRPSPPAPPEKPSVTKPPVTERPTATPPVAAPDTGPAADATPKPIPPPGPRPSISAEHTHEDRAAEHKQEPRHYLIERKGPAPQDSPGGDGP